MTTPPPPPPKKKKTKKKTRGEKEILFIIRSKAVYSVFNRLSDQRKFPSWL